MKRVDRADVIINTTPHDVAIIYQDPYSKKDCKFTYYAGILEIRVQTALSRIYHGSSGVPVFEEKFDELEFKGNVEHITNSRGLIVSRVVAQKMMGDPTYAELDLYVPGGLIRDEKGRVIGAEGLIQLQRGEDRD